VFVFDVEQLRAVKRMVRRSKVSTKVLFLGGLDVSGPREIADPFGGELHQFETTYHRIARLVDVLAAKLASRKESADCIPSDERLPVCK